MDFGVNHGPGLGPAANRLFDHLPLAYRPDADNMFGPGAVTIRNRRPGI